MAAPSRQLIRVRLHFDYPPPAVVGCRLCWLLVDQSSCRVVSDLENLIRDRFELSRGSIVSLFVEDCYLPHTESAYVLRDNDCVRVKVDCLPQVNGNSSNPETPPAKECRKKRRRAAEEEEEEEERNEVSVEWKKKKRKKRSADSLERDKNQTLGDERNNVSEEEQTEKKKKKKNKKDEKEKKVKLNAPVTTHGSPTSTKNTPTRVEQPSKGKKKVEKAKPKKVSSSDSSSSEEDAPPKKPAPKKPAPKTPTSTPAASKAPATTPSPAKPALTKPRPPPSSSSDSSSSSSDEAPSVKTQPKSKPVKPAMANKTTSDASISQQAAPAVEPASSDSEEEIQLVIRKPLQQHLQLQPQLGRGGAGQGPRNGRGRGRPGRGGSVERGRGGGRGGFQRHNGSWDLDYSGAKETSSHHTQPSYNTDKLSNTSVVLQNGAACAARPDYSSMPLLAAPPQVGQKIAFKLLELTENYTPEVSEYKEGKILSFDPTTKQIELEVQHFSQAPAEPGKFDLVYLNPDGTERVEYAVSRGSQVMERWDSLLEPRLII